MSDQLTIEIDNRAAIAALDQLGAAVERYTKTAAKITADNIAREAKARLQRQLSGTSTGATVRGVTVEEARAGVGYVVLPWNPAEPVRMPNLPIWLEFGTVKMTARPYFFASAQLESGAHDRRIREAIGQAIREVGGGD